jgi:hypothetical protein
MLEIDRLSLHVRAAAAPERAERLARRLRDAATAGVERNRFAVDLPGAPAYVFVERLALQCSVSSEWDDAAIGAAVAKSLAAALERSLELPGTVAFRDRVELVAAFYAALTDGRAWERWWFESFDGLRPLSASSALRTSVINEDACGVAALARLTVAALAGVLGLLTASDAKRLLEWFALRHTTAETPILALWKTSASLPRAQEMDARWIAALIAAERTAAGAAGGATLHLLRAMAALRAAAARGEIGLELFVKESAQTSLRAMLSILSLPFGWVDRLGESDAARIVEDLAARASGLEPKDQAPKAAAGEPDASAASERAFTRRGGAFVLLKALDWLGWPALWRGRLESAEADVVVRALALAIVARALDAGEAAGTLRDPALRLAFEVDDPIALLRSRRREIARALRGDEVGANLSRAARRLLEEFARRIPGLADASPGYLRCNALKLSASLDRRGDQCTVCLGRAPLDILLVLAGAKSGRIALPGGTLLELRAEDA